MKIAPNNNKYIDKSIKCNNILWVIVIMFDKEVIRNKV